MKMRSLVLVAAALFATFAVAFDETATFKSTMQKEMDRYVKALKTKDFATMEKIFKEDFSPDFKDTDRTGKSRNLQQTIQAMKQNFGMLKSVQSASLKLVQAKVANGKATTTEHFIMNATMPNMKDTKKTSKLKVDSQWNGSYVKRNGRWICTSTKTTKENVTIDGQRMG